MVAKDQVVFLSTLGCLLLQTTAPRPRMADWEESVGVSLQHAFLFGAVQLFVLPYPSSGHFDL